jgi:hypothetical protein
MSTLSFKFFKDANLFAIFTCYCSLTPWLTESTSLHTKICAARTLIARLSLNSATIIVTIYNYRHICIVWNQYEPLMFTLHRLYEPNSHVVCTNDGFRRLLEGANLVYGVSEKQGAEENTGIHEGGRNSRLEAAAQ